MSDQHIMLAKKVYDTPDEWIVTGSGMPAELWPVIGSAYVAPLLQLCSVHGIALVPSVRSCYRPMEYELSRGRNGRSLHCFPQGSLGACDIRRADGGKIEEVIDVVIDRCPFRRIALYPAQGFIHVDYGGDQLRDSSRRSLWLCDGPLSRWRFMSFLAGPVYGW